MYFKVWKSIHPSPWIMFWEFVKPIIKAFQTQFKLLGPLTRKREKISTFQNQNHIVTKITSIPQLLAINNNNWNSSRFARNI